MNPFQDEVGPRPARPAPIARRVFLWSLAACVTATVLFTLAWIGLFVASFASIGSPNPTLGIIVDALDWLQSACAVVAPAALVVAVASGLLTAFARERRNP